MGFIKGFGKTVLVVLNLIFLLISLVLTGVGVVLKFFTGEILDNLLGSLGSALTAQTQTQFKIPDVSEVEDVPFVGDIGMALMIFGIVLFCISFCACCGACGEFRPLLVVFIIAMTILVITQGVVGGMFLAKDSPLHDQIKKTLKEKIKDDYDPKGDDAFSFGINILNYLLSCCGISGKVDFDTGKVAPTCCKRNIIEQGPGVSATAAAACVSGTAPDTDLNEKGCYTKLQDKVRDQLVIGAVVLALLLFLEVMEIIFAVLIVKDAGKVGPV